MPLYSLIALVLSVFGATYTALGALRAYYDEDVRKNNEVVQQRMNDIKQKAPNSLAVAEPYARCVTFWARIWKWSYSVPIVFFMVVVFLIGIVSLVYWDSIIHPLQVLSAQTTTLSTDEISYQKHFLDGYCNCGRWLLLVVLLVNGICAMAAIFSNRRVMSNGKHLKEIHRTASDAYAAAHLEA